MLDLQYFAEETRTTEETSINTGEDTNKNIEEPVDRRKVFDDFISEHKDLYNERVNQAINRRFKDYDNLKKSAKNVQPLVDMLSMKYNTTNPQELIEALENDNKWLEEEALANGMEINQYKEYMRVKRENEGFRKAEAEAQRLRGIENYTRELYRQEAELKKTYPEFDLKKEMLNSKFAEYIQKQLPVETAYKLVHYDELLNNAVTQAQQETAANITYRKNRPEENGAANSGASSQKIDISRLSDEQMAEYIKRARNGERITFV